MSQSSILIDALSSAIERKKEREKWPGGFLPGQTHPAGCSMLGFSQLLVAVKSCFNGQSLNFMCT
jgi:hypothetical protein